MPGTADVLESWTGDLTNEEKVCMTDATERCPDVTRERGARRSRGATRPQDADGRGVADADPRRLTTGRRAAVTRRANQAVMAAAVRDLRSRGRLDYVG